MSLLLLLENKTENAEEEKNATQFEGLSQLQVSTKLQEITARKWLYIVQQSAWPAKVKVSAMQ